MKKKLAMTVSMIQMAAGPLGAAESKEQMTASYEAYRKVVADTVSMVRDRTAQELAQKHGLQIMDVTWEDTGRFKGSAVGPNISDMTIQVAQLDPRSEKRRLDMMPVIRFPNFSDKTADLRLEDFFVMVGNEKDKKLRKLPLRRLLDDPRRYLSSPGSWKGTHSTLLAPRDSKVLVSAQACFLPVPKLGIAEFNPAVFNYQSYKDNPAVLTILATREGTSVTVIDNSRDPVDGMGMGQRLFFNKNGQRAPFTGQRLSDFKAEAGTATPTVKAAGEEGLNLVLLIQVPLKQKNPRSYGFMDAAEGGMMLQTASAGLSRGASNVEAAVIGHGKVEGPFTEIADLDIERDERFPIRVTVQFYKATSNGVVSEQDLTEIAAQIKKVYDQSDYVGSLVVSGETGRRTEYAGAKEQPAGWWDDFRRQHPGWAGPHRVVGE